MYYSSDDSVFWRLVQHKVECFTTAAYQVPAIN